MAETETRIDKWLWATRLFKTRPFAIKACQGGRISIDGRRAKPSSTVRPEQTIEVRLPGITRTVRVKAVTEKRVGAKFVPDFLEDLTPPAEYERSRKFRQSAPAKRERGAGRPTKKERRETDRFFGI